MSNIKKPLKIALIGTSCVGKTSIIELLRDKYKNEESIEFVAEGARAFFTANPQIIDRGTWGAQVGIRDWVLTNEQAAYDKNPDVIVCDRSVIDSAIYMYAHGNVEGSRKLQEMIREWILTYDHLVLLDPYEVPYHKDEIRIEEPEFRELVHQIFVDFLEKNNINYSLLKGSLEERTKQVDKLFNHLLPMTPLSYKEDTDRVTVTN